MANIKKVVSLGLTRTGTSISDVPDAPTIGAVTDPGTDGYAAVAFTAAATGGTATTYTATSTPGSITATSATSPITVTGLTLSTAYTFKVKGANSTATGAESPASSLFTPITHWAPSGAYDSIATTTAGSGGVSSVTFSSIPQTYTHLQVRIMSQSTYVATADLDSISMRMNGVTSTSYSFHYLRGTGAAVSAAGSANQSYMSLWQQPNTTYSSNPFAVGIVDILDYTNTNKFKTVRSLGGADTNNIGNEVGRIEFGSGLFQDTTAVTSLSFQSGAFTRGFLQYSTFALYGIKGA